MTTSVFDEKAFFGEDFDEEEFFAGLEDEMAEYKLVFVENGKLIVTTKGKKGVTTEAMARRAVRQLKSPLFTGIRLFQIGEDGSETELDISNELTVRPPCPKCGRSLSDSRYHTYNEAHRQWDCRRQKQIRRIR